jgi:hypothetical protein
MSALRCWARPASHPASRLRSGWGVRAGWRCLQAGAGGGSFARWLRSATSPGGRVLAVDADPRHLADLPDCGGEVAQIDLAADELPERAFDFLHTDSCCCT